METLIAILILIAVVLGVYLLVIAWPVIITIVMVGLVTYSIGTGIYDLGWHVLVPIGFATLIGGLIAAFAYHPRDHS